MLIEGAHSRYLAHKNTEDGSSCDLSDTGHQSSEAEIHLEPVATPVPSSCGVFSDLIKVASNEGSDQTQEEEGTGDYNEGRQHFSLSTVDINAGSHVALPTAEVVGLAEVGGSRALLGNLGLTGASCPVDWVCTDANEVDSFGDSRTASRADSQEEHTI